MNVKPFAVAIILFLALPAAARAGRPLEPADWYRFRPLSDVTLAHDGSAAAYLVTTYDRAKDESVAALWSVPWSGGSPRELTPGENVSDPRFSPDGQYLSYLHATGEDAPAQLWLYERAGGKRRAVSHVAGEITAYEWSSDNAHVVLVMRAARDAAAQDGAAKEHKHAAHPLVLDAFQFKQDKTGYLTADSRTHLYLLDVKTGAVTQLTDAPDRQDGAVAFSPDGRELAFVGNKVGSASEVGRDEVYLIGAHAGAKPRLLFSTWSPNHQQLEWTPDGRALTFLQGAEPKFNAYITDAPALADVATGNVRAVAPALDRAVYNPRLSADGRTLLGAIEDDGYQYPAAIELATGAVTPLVPKSVAHELATGGGHTAVLASDDRSPPEVYALESGQLRRLTHHNDALFAELTLGKVADLAFLNRSGTEIHGQIVTPPDYVAGRRYPTILWIHGGPNGQDDHSLELWGYGPPLERQLFATHGYVVLAINYRGGTGRGAEFARAIAADWGDKEVEDLLAGVDHVIAQGIADPDRLGIGGWSYGGLLTDYTIASDARFKAAIAGAGSGNQTAMYGADEYVIQYNAEIGPPWRDTALWLKLSYPFFHADRIHTPTLFLGGDQDFNVPVAGGEQMYQALRTLGVPARLVVYPGEYHVLTRPSFLVDRSQRYLEWMDRYLKAP